MFSIVVVYNNETALNEILLRSLRRQTVKYDLIALDNVKEGYRSAAEALNYAGGKAAGKYIMFVHQDVELGSDAWLEDVERVLEDTPDIGIAGVAGMSGKGTNGIGRRGFIRRGFISDCGNIWGQPLDKIEEVQTLDECLLIVPKSVFGKMKFDAKTFDGWHCYGVDYCLSVRRMALKAYVVPAFIYHRSQRRNVRELLKYHKRLYEKYRNDYRRIYTTCGQISWQRIRFRQLLSFFPPLYRKFFRG
jgi:GT2 family glycosyltransferase